MVIAIAIYFYNEFCRALQVQYKGGDFEDLQRSGITALVIYIITI